MSSGGLIGRVVTVALVVGGRTVVFGAVEGLGSEGGGFASWDWSGLMGALEARTTEWDMVHEVVVTVLDRAGYRAVVRLGTESAGTQLVVVESAQQTFPTLELPAALVRDGLGSTS